MRLAFPFDPDLVAAVARLAASEQKCCAFFDFTMHLTGAALVLTVRAPDAVDALMADLFLFMGSGLATPLRSPPSWRHSSFSSSSLTLAWLTQAWARANRRGSNSQKLRAR